MIKLFTVLTDIFPFRTTGTSQETERWEKTQTLRERYSFDNGSEYPLLPHSYNRMYSLTVFFCRDGHERVPVLSATRATKRYQIPKKDHTFTGILLQELLHTCYSAQCFNANKSLSFVLIDSNSLTGSSEAAE